MTLNPRLIEQIAYPDSGITDSDELEARAAEPHRILEHNCLKCDQPTGPYCPRCYLKTSFVLVQLKQRHYQLQPNIFNHMMPELYDKAAQLAIDYRCLSCNAELPKADSVNAVIAPHITNDNGIKTHPEVPPSKRHFDSFQVS